MAAAPPRLDHVVVDVRERMAEALAVYRALGFHMTERSRHTLGSINHLAVFGTDYLELLGLDAKASAARPEIARYPVGFNGLVFLADEPDRLYRELKASGLPAEEPNSFSRPVQLPGGNEDAKFRVVRFRPGTFPFGRIYFCHHFTPHLVWRPEWRRHPNGASHIVRIVIAVADPAASAQFFTAMFGPAAVSAGPGGVLRLQAGTAVVELVTRAALAQSLGATTPDAAGRGEYMALLGFRTASLAQAKAALAAGGIKGARVEAGRILVPAQAAMNVALEFVA
ncbi:MAG: VOC family protein [Alphaproteobacteria bacterium]